MDQQKAKRRVRRVNAAIRSPRIALLIETSNAYARGLLEGIAAFMRERRTWAIDLSEHERGASDPAWLRDWKGDGIIARIENPVIAAAVAGRKLPTVDLSAARLLVDVPCVETDNKAIAELGVSHLVDRGFRRLGFCGLNAYKWSVDRMEHFASAAKSRGCECHLHVLRKQTVRAADWLVDQQDLAKWVAKLPKPIGIMACYDPRGRQVLDACRAVCARVPDDVAVVGVDNDAVLCDLADPPLSSIAPDAHRTGYTGAQLLDQMLRGHRVGNKTHLIPPIKIVTRRSSDALAIKDPDITTVLRFIRDNACKGIQVDDLLRQAPLSRRMLESRFTQLLGRSPHQEILRCKIERAKELLRETDWPLKAIARECGVSHTEYLSVVFKRATGQSPSEFRRSTGDALT